MTEEKQLKKFGQDNEGMNTEPGQTQDEAVDSARFALMLTKQELQTLAKFAYIGTRVFNYYCKAQDINIGYYEFTDKIYAHYYAAEKGLKSAEEVKDCETASVYNQLEGELCKDITFYEKGVFNELLAELLANKNYPLCDGNDLCDHFHAEKIYLDKLEEKGLSIVDFVAPNIEEEVRARHIPDPSESKSR